MDLTQGVVKVRNTKFHKSRIIILHPSTVQAISEYARFRNSYFPMPSTSHFLLSERGKELKPSAVNYTFQQIRKKLCWRNSHDTRPPRLYDLRHTFACYRLIQWYREGVDVHHAIAWLATYMGHVKVSDTYWYLSGIPKLFAVTAERFESYVASTGGVK